MKIAYISLGCPKNRADLEHLIALLNNHGHDIELEPEKCDAIVINTCGFIESAVTEAIDTVLEMYELIPEHAKLIVTGCMTERYKEDILKEIPEIDFITGVGTLSTVLDYLSGQEIRKDKDFLYNYDRVLTNSPYYAYVKIADGCNNRCSYCTIPSIRGHLTSRPLEDIVKEVEKLASEGVKELILISQDNTKYGRDLYGEPKLVELINKIDELDGDFYIRLMYMNPDGFDYELIKTIKESKKTIKYLDIPVQHINDRILKAMNRKSSTETIKTLYKTLREEIENIFIRTTFIVGFPGETQEDVDEIAEFLVEYAPDYAGFFPYYPEDGTVAALLDDGINKREKKSRISKLQKIQKKITMSRLKKEKKNDIICFVEKADEDFEFILEGRSLFQSPDIDGKSYFIDGRASKGYGPYKCRIKKINYPDIYCEILEPLIGEKK